MQAGPQDHLPYLTPTDTDDLETRIEKACIALRAGRFGGNYTAAGRFYGIVGHANQATLSHNARFLGLYPQSRKASTMTAVDQPGAPTVTNTLGDEPDAIVSDSAAGAPPSVSTHPEPIHWSDNLPPATPHQLRVPLQQPSPHANRIGSAFQLTNNEVYHNLDLLHCT